MRDLMEQEKFEMEALERLNSARLLGHLVFSGGTMLRLCFGLNRFSVDIDFWMVREQNSPLLFKELQTCLSKFYTIKDAKDKFNTIVFEIRSKAFPRSLKIEIRKEIKKVTFEPAIAYSKYSTIQVLLNVVSLNEMMRSKIMAFLDRKEIRDVFDIEFLLKKGIPLDSPPELLKKVLKGMESFTKQNYTVKLGSLLEEDQRKYYVNENFKLLKLAIQEKIR